MRTSPHSSSSTAAVGLALAVLCAIAPQVRAADAQSGTTSGVPDEQVIVPQVERRDVHKPRYPSNDFEFGLYLGGFGTQNFGTSATAGGRVGYHLTEDFFVEASYGQVKINDAAFRRVLPGGVLKTSYERLQTYDLALGYNVLAGEAFFGTKTAKITTGYVTAGLGNTVFDGQRMQTFAYGVGSRVFLNDHFAVRVDARNHLFRLDLLGKRTLTQNYELTFGASYFF